MLFAGDQRAPKSASLAWLLGLFQVVVLLSLPAAALNPDRKISQYAHTAWRIQDGVFGGTPTAIAQTADGYLWIGTNIGLVRFDGAQFTQWNPPPGTRLPDSRIFSLLAARDGSLWIGTGYSLSHWTHGDLINYPQLTGRIEALAEDGEESVWIARTQFTDEEGPLCRIKAEQLQCYRTADGIPFPNALLLANDGSGKLWVAGYSELLRWKQGFSQVYFPNTNHRPEGFALFKAIVTGADGSTWLAIDKSSPSLRLEHFEHESWVPRVFPEIPASTSDVTTLFLDRDHALWIGTARHGAFRVQGNRVEHFGSADGLSSDSIARFYQDKEGTLWVVTSEGIDNFRDLPVASYSIPEGLPAASAVSVLAARDGTIWIIDNYQSLESMHGDKISVIRAGQGLPGRHVSTFCEDYAGRLWLGIDNDVWVYDHGAFRVIRHSDGSPLGIVFAIAEDTHHNIWVRAGPNLYRIENFKVQQELTSPQISTSYVLAATPDGGIVLGLVNGDLVKLPDGKTQSSAVHEAGNTRQIRDLLVESDGSVWGTTLDELFRWKDGVRRNLTTSNGLPCDGIFALVKDDADSIWLYSKCGLIAIARSELNRWWQHPGTTVNVKWMDQFDGVQPGLTSLKPQATKSPDGKLWFVNGRILQMVDPRDLKRNTIPPPVHIEQVVADRISYAPQDPLRLPALTRDLQIDYAALSFVVPHKVRFRYRLEGRDTGWQEAGTRRQAFYNDLQPGKHRFHVIACNNDGVWNEAGDTLTFIIAPAFYQRAWFKMLLFVTAAGLIWLIYFLRVKHLSNQIQSRLDARLEERERIARELHDTLLQGFHGLVLRFQAVMTKMPKQDPVRHTMEEVLDRADDVLLEGRQRIRDLRSEPINVNELPQTLAGFGDTLALDSGITFSLTLIGTPRSLDPIVRDEVYGIGREALTNAFRHSKASNIEAEITYDRARLRLRVRDDGIGMDQAIVDRGRPGHWGLAGMRERAQKIGAQLRIWSNLDAGTEADLIVWAKVAYTHVPRRGPWQWFKHIAGRTEGRHGGSN